jgi:hypothetical protein
LDGGRCIEASGAGAGQRQHRRAAVRCALDVERRRWEPGRSECGGADLTDAEVHRMLGCGGARSQGSASTAHVPKMRSGVSTLVVML